MMQRLKKADLLFVSGIFILNFILKFIYIDYYPLSYDESVSLKNTLLDFGHIKHEAEWDNNPPFYYYCIWIWHTVFPLNEIFSRVLSLLFVSTAISINFVLVKKHTNLLTGIFVSIFLIASGFITFYSQEARAYSLVLLLGVSSSTILFQYLEKKDTKYLILLSVLNFLLIYTHYITALLIFSQFVFLFISNRKILPKVLLVQGAIVLLLVLFRFTKKQFLNIAGFNKGGDFWLQKADLKVLVSSINELYFFAPIFIIALFAALYFYFRNRSEKNDFLLYCLLTGLLPTLILFLIGTQKSVFLSRYIIFTIPFVITFLIGTFLKIPNYGAIIAGIILVASLNSFTLKPEKGQDYRMIASVIKQDYGKNDYILINTSDNVNLFHYYFDYKGFLSKKKDSLLAANRIFGVDDPVQFTQLNIDSAERIYLVQSFHKKENGKNELQEQLKKIFPANTQKYFLGAELNVYGRAVRK